MGAIKLFLTGKGPMTGYIARTYDRAVQVAFRDFVRGTFEDLAGQIAGARRLLDVGCGPGQFTIMAAERLPEAQIVGVDLSPTMIELANGHRAASPAADRVTFEIGDAMALPFADSSFDVAISSGSIKQWPDASRGLAEIHRVLTPGGRAFVLEVNSDAPANAIEAQRVKLQHWLFRLIFPRVVSQGMTPTQARSACVASPFGEPREQRLLLDGVVWMLVAQKPLA
jgi:ubiquinone/menaquinone biosynthesis C-methylase UbiE